MESKEFVRALLWAAVVFFAWQLIAAWIWPPRPPGEARPGVATGPPSDQPVEAPPPQPSGESGAPSQTTPVSEVGAGAVHVVGGSPRTITLGTVAGFQDSPYRMELTLDAVGASVAGAQLSDFTQRVGDDAPRYPMLSTVSLPDGSTIRSFVTEKLYLRNLDANVELQNIAWEVASSAPGQAAFRLTVLNGQTPVLRLGKQYELPQQPRASMRSDLSITYSFENLTDERQTVTLTSSGPVGVPQEDLRFNDRLLFVGARDGGVVDVDSSPMQSGAEKLLYDQDGGVPLVWTAVANKYFAVFESPRPVEGQSAVDWIQQVKTLPLYTDAEGHPIATLRTVTDLIVVEAGDVAQRVIDSYVGPKKRKAFQQVEDYARLDYDAQVVASYSQGACAFMTPKSLTRFMIWMLNSLKRVVRNYGVAIIILVLIVRIILHPVTKKGQVNMMRMQQRMGRLAPKMEEIKKKYANDKQRLNQETMKLYQEEGINPATGMLSSCVPMFLQMPIWIALFTSLNFNIDMRHQPFCLWINDLTAPDALVNFAGQYHVPLLSALTGPITSFNLLPILVSVSMFAQQKLMPKPKPPAGQSSEQAQQAAQMQKMMPYMTLFFGLFFYNMPSGLNLYIGASSFFGMLEQKRIRSHIEELKELETDVQPAGPIVKPAAKAKKGPSLFERLRRAADEAQKVQSARPKRKSKRS